jgi:hypothetical protein
MDILHLAMDRFLVSTWGEFRSSRQFEAHILKIEYPNIQWLSSIFPNFPIKIMFSGRYTQVSDMTSFSEKFCDLMGDPNLCPDSASNQRIRPSLQCAAAVAARLTTSTQMVNDLIH